MEYFARSINQAKWTSKPFMGSDDIAADAITLCLKTTGNCLSLWECSDDIADIHQIALALALGTDKDRLDTMDVVLLPKSALEGEGFVFHATAGLTKVDDLKDRHVDLAHLTLARLSVVAHLIRDRVRQRVTVYRLTRGKLHDLIVEAINQERLDESRLDESTRQAIQRKRGVSQGDVTG